MPASNPAQFADVREAWRFGVENWRLEHVPKRLNLQLMR
jgi:hypothetical protein